MDSYEDRFGRIRRRVERIRRWWRWRHGERRILVETRWRLGDEIMALPIYEALHKAHPDAAIGAWCHYPELLEGHPHARAVTPEDFIPDRYILLRGAPRDTVRIEHYAQLARVPVPAQRPRLYLKNWTPSMPFPAKPYIAFAPGASWPTKRWPESHWQKLAKSLRNAFASVVVLGNKGEGFGVGVDLTGKTTVRDAACLLHHAELAITSDSGLMHLALASGTPVVSLFGPTDPDILVRPSSKFVAVGNGRPCYACWNRSQAMIEAGVCPREIPGCLDTIAVETVLDAVHRMREAP